MRERAAVVHVTYEYRVEYTHPDQLRRIVRELEKAPSFGAVGAEVCADKEVHGYRTHFAGSYGEAEIVSDAKVAPATP